jgi:membrane-associated protein
MQHIVDWLEQLSPAAVYAVAGLLIAAEVGLLAGLVIPVASVLLSLGALASTGHLHLVPAIAVAVAAAVLGDSIGYWEGRWAGPRLRTSRLGRRIGEHGWRRAERAVRRSGGLAIVVGRWTAYVRTLVPRIAGAAGVRYRRFVVYDAAGVLVLMPGYVLAGYLAGAAVLTH